MLFELRAVLAAGLFSGAATYITFVEHPARLACGPAIALAQWRPSYQRATVMQASLALLGLGSAVAAYLAGRGAAVLVGGMVLGAVVPFTLLVIRPTNRRLEAPGLVADTPEIERLLRQWGTLHAVRTAAALVAFGILAGHSIGWV